MTMRIVKALSFALCVVILATSAPAMPAQAQEFTNEKTYGDPVKVTVNHYLGSISSNTLLESVTYDKNSTGFNILEGYGFTAPLYAGWTEETKKKYVFPKQQTITLTEGENVVNYVYISKETVEKASYIVHHQLYIPNFASNYVDGKFTEIKTETVDNNPVGSKVTPKTMTSAEIGAALTDTTIMKINNKSIKDALGYDASFFAIPVAKEVTISVSGNEITYTYDKVKSKSTVRFWTEMGLEELSKTLKGHEKEYTVAQERPSDTTYYVRKNATDAKFIENTGMEVNISNYNIPNKTGYMKPQTVLSNNVVSINDDTVIDVYYELAVKPAVAYVNASYQIGDLVYTLQSNGDAIVEAYKGKDATTVTIPAKITVNKMTYTVKGIADNLFKDNKKITAVEIPNTVVNLGANTFNGCTNLTSVNIPSGVTTIGYSAFANSGLTSVTIPNTVTTIGNFAFVNSKLTSVTIPGSVQIIGNNAFTNSKLTTLTIPNSVTTIGNYAFAGTEINTVTIPASVKVCGEGVFSECKNLGSINFTAKAKMTKLPKKFAYKCTLLSKITIPAQITKMGSSVFEGCSKLSKVTFKTNAKVTSISPKAFMGTAIKKIVIPSKATKIGSGAFMNCKSLKSVTIRAKKFSTIGSKAFKNISKKAVFTTTKETKEKLKKKLSSKSVGYVKTWKVR